MSNDRIFLSHKGSDKALVRRYYDALAAAGLRPWLDTLDLPPGVNPDRGIEQGFQEADSAIFFLTGSFRDRGFLEDEVDHAKRRKRESDGRFLILSVLLPRAAHSKRPLVPSLLRQYVWIEEADHLTSLTRILNAVRHFRAEGEKSTVGEAGVPRQLHHVSLAVSNIEEALAFYIGVLGLSANPERERVGYDFEGAWFTLADRRELHLVQASRPDEKEVATARPYLQDHFALRVESILAFEKRMAKMGKSKDLTKDTILPTRYPQRYLCDPDGHLVEVNSDELREEIDERRALAGGHEGTPNPAGKAGC